MQQTLKQQWETLKSEDPRLRIRDAAKKLSVSEANLIALGVGESNTALKNEFNEILKDVEGLGYVMALTRNDHCVHERKGIYKKASFNGIMGLLVNPDIDLRLFMNHWHFGFAVNENGRLSLQFFDKDGEAVHKIYLTEQSNEPAYHALVEKYKADDQSQQIVTQPVAAQADEKPDSEIDIEAFQTGWRELKDTHDFFGLLKSNGLSRIQAMRLAPKGFAEQLSIDAFKRIMQDISQKDVEIMVFTGSRGCIQIHTGLAKNIVETGPWFNILDPEFNMHLREDAIASIWLVKKPTDDGLVHSLEVYDDKGNIIVQFFGKRKPGIPESTAWRTVLSQLEEVGS